MLERIYGECSTWASVPNSQNKKYTYIRIDNNYSEQDTYVDSTNKVKQLYATTGINGLKVSAAHEFHHAIQFAYNNPNGNNDAI
jgi:hypothetical protein